MDPLQPTCLHLLAWRYGLECQHCITCLEIWPRVSLTTLSLMRCPIVSALYLMPRVHVVSDEYVACGWNKVHVSYVVVLHSNHLNFWCVL